MWAQGLDRVIEAAWERIAMEPAAARPLTLGAIEHVIDELLVRELRGDEPHERFVQTSARRRLMPPLCDARWLGGATSAHRVPEHGLRNARLLCRGRRSPPYPSTAEVSLEIGKGYRQNGLSDLKISHI